jgi:hypothetical protein
VYNLTLSEAYPPCTIQGFTIISDRDKGLAPAIEKLLPNTSHAKCCHHIKDNLVSNSLVLIRPYTNLN